MNKILRSLIHEKFPFDLRVKMELISKRRDCSNGEKQHEIINLLRTNGLDVTELGSGTNRYAFKLDGFVVKVATDNDGKIDNLKEFKMAKRLYPYVTKIYEVSENGTLLVAEYIQPFTSFTEMCVYQDKIRKILSELSSVYLIGDVGISSNNYSNWGLRIGTDDPVCLDFAYVYNVRSELFVCTACKTNSMLVPDNDFKELHCSNPACGKRVKFEEIRSRIGNDIHKHEIGDLSEEGYKILSSNVLTELTEEQSNYLTRKKNKKASKKQQDINDDSTYNYLVIKEDVDNKEENDMSNKDYASIAKEYAKNINGDSYIEEEDYVVMNATAVPVNRGPRRRPPQKTQNVTVSETVVVEEEKEEIDEKEKAAIKALLNDNESSTNEEVVKETTIIVEQHEDDGSELAFECKIDENEDGDNYFDIESTSETDEDDDQDDVESADVAFSSSIDEDEEKEDIEDTDSEADAAVYDAGLYINNIKTSISKISNMICKFSLIETNMFDQVKNHILYKRILPESFYKHTQDCIYKSLMEFCGFTQETQQQPNGKSIKFYSAPSGNLDEEYFNDTLTFIERWWTYKEINSSDNPMAVYREMFNDCDGIQYAWFEDLEKMIKNNMSISKNGIDKIVEGIKSTWCSTESLPSSVDDHEEDEDDNNNYTETSEDDKQETKDEVGEKINEYRDELINEIMNGIDEYIGDDDEEEYLSVRICHATDTDIITIGYIMEYRFVEIPFYVSLDKIILDENKFSFNKYIENGIWDWVIHTRPAIIFKTKHPKEWLDYLNNGELEEGKPIAAIISEKDGFTFIGIYYLSGVYVLIPDEDESNVNEELALDEEIIAKVNIIVNKNIANGSVSSLSRSISTLDKAYDDLTIAKTMLDLTDENSKEFMEIISTEDTSDDSEEQIVVEEEKEEIDEKEKAAIKALLNDNESSTNEEVVKETTIIVEQHEDDGSNDVEDMMIIKPIRRKNG